MDAIVASLTEQFGICSIHHFLQLFLRGADLFEVVGYLLNLLLLEVELGPHRLLLIVFIQQEFLDLITEDLQLRYDAIEHLDDVYLYPSIVLQKPIADVLHVVVSQDEFRPHASIKLLITFILCLEVTTHIVR